MTDRDASGKQVRTSGMSMAPFIPPGSILTVSRVGPENLRPGDVVCYIDETGDGVAHRIIGIETRNNKPVFILQGDAHPLNEVVPAESIVYQVQKVAIGPIFYRCHGVWGQLFSSMARSQAFPSRCIRRIFLNLWRGAVSVQRLYRR